MTVLAQLHADAVRILPLGGLGEIGLNLLVVESRGALVLIDCGLMFPEAYMLGIDLVVPDIAALTGRTADIQALLLTHGHEVHIGAIPFLLEALGNPPIYGTALSLGLQVRFVLPHAPARPVTLNMGMIMPAWYDIVRLEGPDGHANQSHVRESCAQLAALVAREEQRGLPSERVVLAGFSQGGAIALHQGTRTAAALYQELAALR